MTEDQKDPTLPEDSEGIRFSPRRAIGSAAGPGEAFGPYRLLQQLGEGGMGEVWLAEQTEPVRRRVALKVIKQGMGSKDVIARFEAERQALALMDHPCVAKVFDAGSTPAGCPYFAMEYVSGMPLMQHCDRHRLSLRERLELFVQICEGVQHAHQKAILHRDLKPSNVLVSLQDGKPVPKIIDFGVAKATAQPLTEHTLYTALGVLIGTPEYMSPEQADLTGQDVDTRTDVYSLGVILYELLVGALPFEPKELRGAGLDGIRRMIRDVEPRRPSTRLSTLGAGRSTDSARRRRADVSTLRRELSGDLDWIVMKALAKERARRYGSAAELAADVRRHLGHEPVAARPPSAVYRARKFVRRHRVGVAFALSAVTGLVGFAVTMAVQASRIARGAEAKARVTEFLTDLFQVSDPSEARGNNITARELLDKGAVRIRETLTEEPEIRAELMATMGNVYLNLGLYAAGESLHREALEVRRQALGSRDPHTLESMNDLGLAYARQGRYHEAETLLREALDLRRRILGPEHPDTLGSTNNLSGVILDQGRFAEAEALQRETLGIRRRVLGSEHPETLRSMNILALTCSGQGRFAEAEALQRETLEIRRRILGPDHPDTLGSMNNLAIVYSHQGRHADAEALHRETLEIRERVLGSDHPNTLSSMLGLASSYSDQGRFAEATALDRNVLEIRRRILGPDHPDTLISMNNLAVGDSYEGNFAEAETLHREALELQKRVLGPDHPDTVTSTYNLACLAAIQGRRQEALLFLSEAVKHGYSGVDVMIEDSSLASLRGDPEFEKTLAAARKNQERLTGPK